MKIAVDWWSGDGQGDWAHAALKALSKRREGDLEVILFGDQGQIEKEISAHKLLKKHSDRIGIVDVRDYLDMNGDKVKQISDEEVLIPIDWNRSGVRGELSETSLGRALAAHKEGNVDAVISGTETGALIMSSIGMLSRDQRFRDLGYKKLPFCAPIPSQIGHNGVLIDAGATNGDIEPRHLVDFGLIGLAYHNVVQDGYMRLSSGRIGLLSRGHEVKKLPSQLYHEAHEMLLSLGDVYAGPSEPYALLSGDVSVLVSTGTDGNLVLKSIEATGKLAKANWENFIGMEWYKKLMLAVATGGNVVKFARSMDPNYYNGTPIIGIKGDVLKSHGGANLKGKTYAILNAARYIENGGRDTFFDELGRLTSMYKPVGEKVA